MTLPQQAREAVVHPLTQLSAFLSVLGAWGFGWFEPVWTLISATSSYWFPAIAVTAGEILSVTITGSDEYRLELAGDDVTDALSG